VLYQRWEGMIQRCTNPKAANFPDYGGRGITVCDSWRSFEAFYADMGDPPPGRTLERIDNSKGYEPDNCRWATRSEQRANQRPCKAYGRSRFKGVCWSSAKQRWVARVQADGRRRFLGYFDTEEQAASAVSAAP